MTKTNEQPKHEKKQTTDCGERCNEKKTTTRNKANTTKTKNSK